MPNKNIDPFDTAVNWTVSVVCAVVIIGLIIRFVLLPFVFWIFS